MAQEQAELRELLASGEITDCELSPWGSNYTFLATVRAGGRAVRAVYKPRQGEAPLWDFPDGTLYKREYASYLLSRLLGWEFIPLTLIRDGPFGVGAVQLYVEHDPECNYFQLRERHRDVLRVMALFDVVANNADRKAGHCLLDRQGRVWGIDHGLTFHPQPKLRTVIRDFCGTPIPEGLLAPLRRLRAALAHPNGAARELVALLEPLEVEALARRVEAVLARPEFPPLHPYRNVPRPPW